MASGNECPECRCDIGLWAIMKAPTPNRFYCPNCRERLWYRGIEGVIAVFAVILVGLFVAAFVAAWMTGFENVLTALGIGVGVFVIGFVLFELSYALVLRNGGYQLESANHSADELDDEVF